MSTETEDPVCERCGGQIVGSRVLGLDGGVVHRAPVQCLIELKCQVQLLTQQLANAWRSIESAPKDGTWIELWWPALRERDTDNALRTPLGFVYARWEGSSWPEDGWWGGIGVCYALVEPGPTHWRQLPEPPKASGSDQG